MTIALIISIALNVLLAVVLAMLMYLQHLKTIATAAATKDIRERITKLEIAARQPQKVMVVERPVPAEPARPSPAPQDRGRPLTAPT